MPRRRCAGAPSGAVRLQLVRWARRREQFEIGHGEQLPHSLDREEAIRSRAHAIWEREGRPDGKDLHHWYQAERESAAEQRFRLAVEAVPNAMIIVNRAGEIVMVNGLAERVFGYTRSELLGNSVEMLPDRFRGDHPKLRAGFHADPRPRPMGVGRDLYGVKKWQRVPDRNRIERDRDR